MVGLQDALLQRTGKQIVLNTLDEIDLPAAALETHRLYIPQLAQLRFFDRMARQGGVENIVFLLADGAQIQSYGLFGQYVTSSEKFGDALRLARDMMAFHSSHDRLSVQQEGAGFRLTYHSAIRNASGYPHYATLAICVLLSIAKPYFGVGLRTQIEFNFVKPRTIAPYEALFNCPVKFGQSDLCIVFEPDAEYRRREVQAQSRVTLEEVARDAFGPAPNDLVTTVEGVLRVYLSDTISVNDVARRLDFSERTLRRRLNEQGVNFRDLSKKIRIETAQELLICTNLGITEISERVGYSDPSHFGHAFRSLTGRSPTSARTAQVTRILAENR
jgi:AraC-like DNA-binding protein